MSLAVLRDRLAEPRAHVSPFLVLGDPDPARSLRLLRAAVAAGAGMLELGIPYDDPCADGPAIQAASERARAAGMTTDRAFELLAALRASCPGVACNLLVYGNLVHARGYRAFCRDAVQAGASSLLVPDVPLEEHPPLADACHDAGLGVVHLVGPRSPRARVEALAAASDAFVYLAAHQGVTGQRHAGDRTRRVREVAAWSARPVCVGFGLSSPDAVRAVCAAGARIAVVGSHLARVLARHASADGDALERAFLQALRPLLTVPTEMEKPQCS